MLRLGSLRRASPHRRWLTTTTTPGRAMRQRRLRAGPKAAARSAARTGGGRQHRAAARSPARPRSCVFVARPLPDNVFFRHERKINLRYGCTDTWRKGIKWSCLFDSLIRASPPRVFGPHLSKPRSEVAAVSGGCPRQDIWNREARHVHVDVDVHVGPSSPRAVGVASCHTSARGRPAPPAPESPAVPGRRPDPPRQVRPLPYTHRALKYPRIRFAPGPH